MATRDGSLWIVWRLGAVTRLRAGRVTTYGERDGLATTFQLAESRDGGLVAATLKGLAQFVDGKWQDVSRAWHYPGTESRAVWFDRDDALWVQTEDRMIYRPKGSNQFLDPGLPRIRFPARADFDQEGDGTIWMSEVSRSAHSLRRVGEDTVQISEIMVGATALLVDRFGSLWIASAGDGLRRVIDPRRIRGRQVAQMGPEAEHFTMKHGLLADDPEALLEDREGNIWVGTARGLESFRTGAFTPFAAIGQNRSRYVFASRDTTLWTAAFNIDGILRINARGRQDTVSSNFGAISLAEDSSGVIWGAYGNSIMRIERCNPDVFVRLRLRFRSQKAVRHHAY